MRKKRPTRRDAVDAARLKLQGDPSHINPREDRLLAETMPEAHGRVVTRGLLAEAGRLGDDRVTRLIPAEAALLRRSGGAGTRNPASGLLEYWGGDDSDDGGMSGSEGNDSVGSGGRSGDSKSGDTMSGENSGGGDYYGLNARSQIGYGRFSQPAVESLLAAPNFAMPGVSFTQYAPQDTWGRAWQEYMTPHPAAMAATPGRLGVPNAHGPGIMGSVVSQLVGGPMAAVMGVGAAMGRASSKETQEASAKEDAARSGHNSGGNQGSHSVQAMDAALSEMAGAQSGAQTAQLPQAPPPGYTVNPAGQIVPIGGGDDRRGLPQPVENLLYDYIWRGRQGSGWGW